LATVGLYGPQAWSLIEPIFKSRGQPPRINGKAGQFWLGRLGDDLCDDVVVTIESDGDHQRVEIHCHGGNAVVRWLLDLLGRRGAVTVSWQEWVRRTARSALQAEATIALARAPTLRTAGILLDQYHGALERELHAIEAEFASGARQSAKCRIDLLINRIPLGKHLTEPWRVVVAGATNVGKSTLINALLGYQRAITSDIPGTTRDVLTAITAFDGWPIELVDTAGLRTPAEGLEALGIERTEQALAEADLVLWVIDRSQSCPVLPPPTLCSAPLLVCNKIDLPAGCENSKLSFEARSVSALIGQGITELWAAISLRLVPEPPPAGAAVPFTDEVYRRIADLANAWHDG
jgi:tRNA modification GTPase